MSKRFTLQLKAEGFDEYDIAEELEQVAEKIRDGFTSGYLNTGSWSLSSDEVCEECGGLNGEHQDITTMERVYANEPHMAPIGTAKCPLAN